jgi:hypothetical protein
MLAFYNTAPQHSNWQRGFTSWSFLVAFHSQSRPVRRRCNTRSQRTDNINYSNDAGIALKFWCSQLKRPAVYQ